MKARRQRRDVDVAIATNVSISTTKTDYMCHICAFGAYTAATNDDIFSTQRYWCHS